jgi:signal transduction histidine kinase/CheY-like chemotaxis protein
VDSLTATRQIERFLAWNFRAAVAAAGFVFGVWLLYPWPIALYMVGVVCANAAIVKSAERLARRGFHEAAARRFAMSAWLVALLVGVIIPAVFATVVLVAFLPLAIVIPYGSRRTKILSLAVAGGIAALLAAVTFLPPVVPLTDIPPSALHAVNVLFIPVLATLFCLSVWSGFQLLQDTHREVQEANVALQESEASLERKVARRTAELEHSRHELADARDAAVAANAAKSRFLAAASHDLRQPIHALRLFAEALGDGDDPARMRGLAHQIRNSADSLTAMFDELLDLSRLESGSVAPRLADFPLGPLIEQLATELAQDAAARGITLDVVKTSAVVRSDPLLLRRILQNLLVNALRHTESGRVLVGCRRRGKVLRIEVWDTGPGIPEGKRAEIFGEFTQLDQKRRSEGLGLGLAIVDKLARLLDCPVELESVVGKGSVFRVSVPLCVRTEPVRADAVSAPVAGMLAGRMIVVIDDDLHILEAMRVLLEGWGCDLVLARSAQDALEGLAQRGREPDVIVADYSLEDGLTGVDAIEAVRKAHGARTPGVIITGETDRGVLEHVRAAGLAHLTKPIPPARLRAALTSAQRSSA